MSKRFGRNQRRRAREEQARLSAALEMSQGLARHLSESRASLESEIEDAKEFACRFSAAFEPQAWDLGGPRRGRVEVYEEPRFSFEAAMSPAEATIQRLPLQMLLAEVDTDPFRSAMHCRVRFGDGTWGYGMTDQAIRSMPRRRFVELVAKSLAEQIAMDLGK